MNEIMRTLFQELQPDQWLGLLGLENGNPFCLQVIREKFVIGNKELEEALWSFLLNNDILSDYAAAPCHLGAIIVPLAAALPPELKLPFCIQIYQRHCPASTLDTYDPGMITRHNRALMATLLLDSKDLAKFVQQLCPQQASKSWRPMLKFLAFGRLQNINVMLKSDWKKANSILEKNWSKVLMECICHGIPDHLPTFIDDNLQRSLLDASAFWSGLMHIRSEGVCVHQLFQYSAIFCGLD